MLLFLLFMSVAHADTLPDPLQAGWQGRPVCEKIHGTAQIRILRSTFPPGIGYEALNIGDTTVAYLMIEPK